jgi:iron(III) transport system permease protein
MSARNDTTFRTARSVEAGRLPGPAPQGHFPRWRRGLAIALSWRFVLILAAAAVTALVLLVPLYLVVRGLSAGPEAIQTLFSGRTLSMLANTLLLAVAVTLAAAALAIPLAWLTTATDLPGRRLWSVLVALPLILPSYVVAFIHVSLLSPKGLTQQLLEPIFGIERLPNLYGFPGAFLVLTLITYPYILLTVRGAIQRLDPSLGEAARSLGLGPWGVFRRVTLPHLRPSVLAGALLVILYVLRDFGAVTLLQYNTFTRAIYNRYQSYQLDMAALYAATLVILTVTILYFEQRSRGRARYNRLSAGSSRRRQPTQLGKWQVPALAFTGFVVFCALGLPVITLFYWLWRGWQGQTAVHQLGTMGDNLASLSDLLEPAWHTTSASLAAAILTVLLALPIVILAVRRPGRLSHLFERIAYAGFALPGIVIALAFVFFGIQFAPSLYQTLPMLLAAYVILFLPQAIGAERASLLQVSPALEEAGRSLGRHPLSVMRRVTLPLIRPGLVGAGLLVCLTTMKELPATLILSPLGFSTLSGQVWSNIGEAFFARAALPTLALLVISSIPLAWLTMRDNQA